MAYTCNLKGIVEIEKMGRRWMYVEQDHDICAFKVRKFKDI